MKLAVSHFLNVSALLVSLAPNTCRNGIPAATRCRRRPNLWRHMLGLEGRTWILTLSLKRQSHYIIQQVQAYRYAYLAPPPYCRPRLLSRPKLSGQLPLFSSGAMRHAASGPDAPQRVTAGLSGRPVVTIGQEQLAPCGLFSKANNFLLTKVASRTFRRGAGLPRWRGGTWPRKDFILSLVSCKLVENSQSCTSAIVFSNKTWCAGWHDMLQYHFFFEDMFVQAFFCMCHTTCSACS